MIPAHLSEVAEAIEAGPCIEICALEDGRWYSKTEREKEFATRIALMAAAAQAEQDAKICGAKAKAAMDAAGEAYSLNGNSEWSGVAHFKRSAACYNECEQAIRAQALAQKQHD